MVRYKHYISAFGLVLATAVLLLGLLGCLGRNRFDQGSGPFPAGGGQTSAVAIADLNGDGKADLVSSVGYAGPMDPSSGFVSVSLQSATLAGSFLGPFQYGAGVNPAGFAVARFTASALPGLAVVNRPLGLNSSPVNTVSVLLPDPANAGGFLAPIALPVGSRNPTDVAVGDLNGDGGADVAVAADGGSDVLVFFQGSPAGTFGAPVSVAAGGLPTALAIADLNGDGLADLVVAMAGNSIAVILQDAAHPGQFLAPVSYPVGVGPVSVKILDLNGDGHPDLIVGNGGTATAASTQGVTVLLQNPAQAGSFLPGVSYDVGDSYTACVVAGDLNGDGRPDIAVANQGLPGLPGSVSVLLQDPANPGAFLPAVVYGGVYGPASVAIGDLNGDGLPDLAIADGGTFVRFQIPGSPGSFGGLFQFLR